MCLTFFSPLSTIAMKIWYSFFSNSGLNSCNSTKIPGVRVITLKKKKKRKNRGKIPPHPRQVGLVDSIARSMQYLKSSKRRFSSKIWMGFVSVIMNCVTFLMRNQKDNDVLGD